MLWCVGGVQSQSYNHNPTSHLALTLDMYSRPRLARAVKGLKPRFFDPSSPQATRGSIAIFSHLDPVAYMATEFAGLEDAALTGPVSPCGMFQLRRVRLPQPDPEGSRGGGGGGGGEDEKSPVAKFDIVLNGSIQHLRELGPTEPSHPIHSYHDWCRLFEEMRQDGLVPNSFR